MKPELGNAATSAPKAASLSFTAGLSVTPIVKATINADTRNQTSRIDGLSSCEIGVFMPKRNSRQGSAK